MKKPATILMMAFTLSADLHGTALGTGGPYLGAAYGLTTYDDGDLFTSQQDLPAYQGADLDAGGELWQIYGGYRFLRYLSVEGRYSNFGDYSAELSAQEAPVTDEAGDEITTELSSLTLHCVGILPIGGSGFDLYGQIGWGVIFYQASFDVVEGDASTLSSGLGLRYTPPGIQTMTLQLAYDIYAFEVEAGKGVTGDTFDQRLGMGKFGIQYNF